MTWVNHSNSVYRSKDIAIIRRQENNATSKKAREFPAIPAFTKIDNAATSNNNILNEAITLTKSRFISVNRSFVVFNVRRQIKLV